MKAGSPSSSMQMAANLRRRAEDLLREHSLAQASAVAAQLLRSGDDPQRLLHELQVHQIELEMQNEHLEAARACMEAALASYVDLYDFAPVAYFTLDRPGTILETNLAGARLLGRERARLLDQRLANFAAKSGRGAFNAFLKQVFSGRTGGRHELTVASADGALRTVEIQAALAVDGESCRAVAIDISERVARERQAALQAEVFAQAPDSICIVDSQGIIVDVNGAFCATLGFQREQVLGQAMHTVRLDEQSSSVEEIMARAPMADGSWGARYRHHGGALLPVTESASAIRQPGGMLQHYVFQLRRATCADAG